MYQIVLPVDDNENRALAAAETVVSLPTADNELEVLILNVLENFKAPDDTGSITAAEVFNNSEPPGTVETVRQFLEDEGVSVTVERELGDPAETILEVSENSNSDAIVISGRRRSPAGKVLFGSVTQSVLLGSDIPVIVSMA